MQATPERAEWLDEAGRFFNPKARFAEVALGSGCCIVVDDVLARPQALVDWAARQAFVAPGGVPYPGQVCAAPPAFASLLADFFLQHVQRRLGLRRVLETSVRASIVSTPPAQLQPVQWQCHRDRLAVDRGPIGIAASVLYLFHEPRLGGTSFYRPRRPLPEIQRMVEDSIVLDATAFGSRYGVAAGYMVDGNAHFERIASVPAAWNRMIFYDGDQFHSGDIHDPALLTPDPLRGRLTFNGFFTCRRAAA